jgi:hypothetical protein
LNSMDYWPNQTPVKKADKFDLPGPETDSHGNVIGDNEIPIAVLDISREGSPTLYTQQNQKLPPSFEALRRHGFKFTSYEER